MKTRIALDRLYSTRFLSILAMSLLIEMLSREAIVFKALQNSSSNVTLVAWPDIVTERFFMINREAQSLITDRPTHQIALTLADQAQSQLLLGCYRHCKPSLQF